MNNLLLKSYVLFFAILGILAFLYKSIFGKYLIKTKEYIVEKINHLNSEVIEIVLSPKDERLQFNAGQFVFVSFQQEGLSESHPFSISSGPNDDRLSITVKGSGDFTENLIRNLQKGITVNIEGPYGVFSYNKTANKNQVWIAGGIGITPFISFVKDIIEKKIQDINITLFYCVKNSKEAVYLNFFRSVIDSFSNQFSIIPFFSAEHGHITTEYVRWHVKNFNKNDYFITAPPKMIKELTSQLIDDGINKDKIYSEEFNF